MIGLLVSVGVLVVFAVHAAAEFGRYRKARVRAAVRPPASYLAVSVALLGASAVGVVVAVVAFTS